MVPMTEKSSRHNTTSVHKPIWLPPNKTRTILLAVCFSLEFVLSPGTPPIFANTRIVL